MDNDDYLLFAKEVIDLYEKGDIGKMGELINNVRLTAQKEPSCNEGVEAQFVKQERADKLIAELDAIGRKRCNIEYGLPRNDWEDLDRMRSAIYEWMKTI